MRPTEVRRISRDGRDIEGWFTSEAAGLFGLIDELQGEAGVRGDLFEIGAHHGKSATMLGAMSRNGETLGVCDIFTSQDANVSGSGLGDRDIFEANMRRIAPTAKVTVYEKASSALTVDELPTPHRFFHIDGGHLAEEALSDLRLAAPVLDAGGVIVLDDPFHAEWPGVTEGALQFMSEHEEYVPVALGFNKLVLTAAPALYGALATGRTWEYIPGQLFTTKRLPIAGRDALIFYERSDGHMAWFHQLATDALTTATRVRRRLRSLVGTGAA